MSDDIINIEPHITLKEAVQRRLAADLDADAGLQARLEADPGAVIKPIIAELIGDDGEIDLSTATTTVHIESDTNLHFVITPGAARADLDEVSGFELMGLSGLLGSTAVSLDAFEGTGIKIDETTARRCPVDGPLSTTHRNCPGSTLRPKHC